MNDRYRIVVEELEPQGDDAPIWTLSIYRRAGDRWRTVAMSPEFYPTWYAALTTARDWITRQRRARPEAAGAGRERSEDTG